MFPPNLIAGSLFVFPKHIRVVKLLLRLGNRSFLPLPVSTLCLGDEIKNMASLGNSTRDQDTVRFFNNYLRVYYGFKLLLV
jgi:hypothetical protein